MMIFALTSLFLTLCKTTTTAIITNLKKGVLLPANARVLSRNMLPFDLFLDEFPTSQLLVWTGHGEPPISKSILHQIQNHFFRKEGRQDCIGFDVEVCTVYTKTAWI